MDKSIMIKSGLAIILAYVSTLFGSIDLTLKVLLVCMIFDYITGIVKAFILKELDSRKGLIGIAKKVFILVVVIIANMLDKIISANGLNLDFVRDITIMFYIVNEIISILENVGEFIEIPDFIRNALAQLKKGGNNNG